MSKIAFGVLVSLTLLTTSSAQAATFRVQSANTSSPVSNHMKPTILVKTDSGSADVNGYTVSYYFYLANLPASFNQPTAPAGTTVTVKPLPDTYTVSDTVFANWVAEIKFTRSTTVTTSGIFLSLDLTATDNRSFYEGDDYSFRSSTALADNTAITLKDTAKTVRWGTGPITNWSFVLSKAAQKIKHVFVIMQENRSFDNYFGSFPGADGSKGLPGQSFSCSGITTQNFSPNQNPSSTLDPNFPHFLPDAVKCMGCPSATGTNTTCTPSPTPVPYKNFLQAAVDNSSTNCTVANLKRVMGYYDGSTPSAPLYPYWTLARNFVLQDKMFQPAPSYSKVQHLFMVSGWSATCDVTTGLCTERLDEPGSKPYYWGEITGLFRQHNPPITWSYIKGENWDFHCASCGSSPGSCVGGVQDSIIDFWSPLSSFASVAFSGQTSNIQSLSTFWARTTPTAPESAAPQVTWIVPGYAVSEHATYDVISGQSYVMALIQGIMKDTDLWNSSAIFLSWDDWGGFYDHVSVPTRNGKLLYGPRVPAMVISPYIKQPATPDPTYPSGFIDKQVMSHDAYLKFIEDVFLGGSRISSADGRPVQRETIMGSSDLLKDFDFNRSPMAPPASVLNLPCHL